MAKFFVLKESATDSGSACIAAGNPMVGWRAISTWAEVQALAAEYGLGLDIKTWPIKTSAQANLLWGKPPSGTVGTGITLDEIRKVVDEELDEAFQGGADNDPASP